MACRLAGAKPLFQPILELLTGPLGTNFGKVIDQNLHIFIKEYTVENVCQLAPILSQLNKLNGNKYQVIQGSDYFGNGWPVLRAALM